MTTQIKHTCDHCGTEQLAEINEHTNFHLQLLPPAGWSRVTATVHVERDTPEHYAHPALPQVAQRKMIMPVRASALVCDDCAKGLHLYVHDAALKLREEPEPDFAAIGPAIVGGRR